MQAIRITSHGGPEVLKIEQVPDPEVHRGDILVDVAAAGLNRADLLQRRGLYPPPRGIDPDIPGLEISGTVSRSADPLERFRVGDRVMALLGGGGYATRAAVPAEHALALPDSLTFEEGAALPEVFLTAFDALFHQLRLGIGDWLLIHAVGSGVGTAALQLAKASGINVIGTSRSPEKLELASSLGLEFGLSSRQESWVNEVTRITNGRGVDAILDLVGAALWRENLEVLRPLGGLLIVGLVSGSLVEADLSVLLRKRLRVLGTALRSRSREEKACLVQEFAEKVLPMFRAGRLRVHLDRVVPWGEAAEAHRYMEDNRNFGKIALSVRTSHSEWVCYDPGTHAGQG